jgi:LysR family transcriptional regulator, nod-box dependent transcriptional activator
MRLQRLDLNLLVLFNSLLNHENVSRAASELNLTQPAVSNALARLRQHFEDDLFVMTGRRMAPTPLADSLREPISNFLELSKSIARSRRGFDPATSEQTFSIVSSDYIAVTLLTRLARRLSGIAPNVTIRHVPICDEALELVYQGTHDLLIAPASVIAQPLQSTPLFEETFVPIASADNEAVGPELSLEQYLGARHVVAQFGHRSRPTVIEQFLASNGYDLRNCVIVESFLMFADFVAGTPLLATAQKRYALEKQKQMPIKILAPTFDLPSIHEHLFWSLHLDTDPASRWLRGEIVSCINMIVH